MSRRQNKEDKAVKTQRPAGLTTMEYAVFILAMVLAIVAVQTTLRRAVSARWRTTADSIFGSGRQYEPGGVTTVMSN